MRKHHPKARFIEVDGKPYTTGNACSKLGRFLFYSALIDDYGKIETTDEERQHTFSILYFNAKQKYREKNPNFKIQHSMPEY